MEGELFLKKIDETEIGKKISHIDAIEFIRKIEDQTNWKIFPIIKDVLDKKIDSASMDKDKPYTFLYVGNSSEKISVTFKTIDKEAKISIPKDTLASKI